MRAVEGWRRGEIFNPIAAGNARGRIQRHQQRAVVLKSDHFRDRLPAAETCDAAQRSHRAAPDRSASIVSPPIAWTCPATR